MTMADLSPELKAYLDGIRNDVGLLAARVEQLSGPQLIAVGGIGATDGEGGSVPENMQLVEVQAVVPQVGNGYLEWMTSLSGMHPLVLDATAARSQPCLRFALSEEEGQPALVLQKGIFGPLTPEQQATYCTAYHDVELPEHEQERLLVIRDSARECGRESEGLQGPYFACIAEELFARGL